MAERRIELEPGWLAALEGEFYKPYMQSLKAFLQAEKNRRQSRLSAGAADF
jgi:uracil DNA glycosylase